MSVTDPVVSGGSIFTVVGLAPSYIPGRRAAKVDLVVALRQR